MRPNSFTTCLALIAAIQVQAAALDEWTYRSSGLGAANFTAAAFGQGRFVVAGSAAGTVLVSSDNGVTWTTRVHGQMPQILDVAYGEGMFMGVGSLGSVITSTNAESWTALTLTNSSAVTFYAVAHGKGRFVVVGEQDTGDLNFYGTSYTSTNGLDWSHWRSSAASNLRDVAFGNGQFVALGSGFNRAPSPDRRVLVSSNGLDWTPRDAAGYTDLRAITYGNGQFVAVARHSNVVAMITSGDAVNWVPHVLPLTNYFITRIGFGNGTYVAVGSLNQSRHILLHSTNGSNWAVQHIGPQVGNHFLYDVAFGHSTFIVVGQPNTIAQSGDVSIPRFERIVRAAGRTELAIAGEVGRAYQLQHSADLSNWNDLVTYTNALPTERVTDVASASNRLYRVRRSN